MVSQMRRRPATSTRGLTSTDVGPADRAAEGGWRSTPPPLDKGGFPAGVGAARMQAGPGASSDTETLRGSESAHLLPDLPLCKNLR